MNSNDVIVSVIVPVYGTEKYIRKCADSLLNQSFNKFEVIFVDDGSKDNCPQICDEYCKKDDRFRVIHKSNEGLGLARNSGLEIIRGEYFTFLDSDDWLDCNHLQTLVLASEQGKMDVIISGCTHCTENQIISYSPIYKMGEIHKEDIVNDIMLPIIAPGDENASELSIPMSVFFNLYKASIAKSNELKFPSERETVGEDLFFNLEFLNLSKNIKCIDWHGYYYRINENSISRKYNPERLIRTENYYRLLKQTINKLGISSQVGKRVERSTLSKFRAAIRLASNSSDNFKVKYKECKRILNSLVLQEILCSYPLDTYRKTIRIVSILMKRKNVLLTIFVFRMERIIKKEK
jgi:glycosyltransferase involved in cell wall biosynthesis